jgi:hypothetical protein
MILNLADISHLKELKAVGEHGRTIRAFNTRLVLDRLAKYGYVAARSTGLELVQYRITKRGRRRHPGAHRMTLRSNFGAIRTVWKLAVEFISIKMLTLSDQTRCIDRRGRILRPIQLVLDVASKLLTRRQHVGPVFHFQARHFIALRGVF